MTNGFVAVIGRLFRKRTAAPMPVRKVAIVVTGPHPDQVLPCRFLSVYGPGAAAPQSSPLPGFDVDIDTLRDIARAADSLENLLNEFAIDDNKIELRADGDVRTMLAGALEELRLALRPYRDAHEAHAEGKV